MEKKICFGGRVQGRFGEGGFETGSPLEREAARRKAAIMWEAVKKAGKGKKYYTSATKKPR